MSWKNMIMGEQMPDKDDPKYRDRYRKEVDAGRRFAKMTRIDKAAAKVQGFANGHRKAFLVLVFGFIIGSFCFNMYRIGKAYSSQKVHSSAIEQQEQFVRNRRKDHSNLKRKDIQENINPNKKDNGYTEED